MSDQRKGKLAALAAAACVALVILGASYPGFMSYDGLHALREARGTVQGGTYPPFVSYVWRIFDRLWPGPALMLLVQNFLLCFSAALLIKSSGCPTRRLVALTIAVPFLPVILGPMLVVWKDVAMAACFCAAAACIRLNEAGAPRTWVSATALAFMFLGAAYRFNALPAALPLLAWMAYNRIRAGHGRAATCAATICVFLAIATLVHVINTRRLPSFEPLARNSGFDLIMVHDLVAMSAISERLLPPAYPVDDGTASALRYLREIHDPRHINLTLEHDRLRRLAYLQNLPGERIRSAWLDAVRALPSTYLAHRNAVFAHMIGATAGMMFYPTHIGVDPNEFGIVHRPNALTAPVLGYLVSLSSTALGKPWAYFLLGTLALPFALRRRRGVAAASVALYASAVFYLIPLYFIAPAADLRYSLWPVVCMALLTILAMTGGRMSTRKTEGKAT